MSVRRNNKVTKNLKDYAVPLIGLFIVLIIIFNIFSWTNNNSSNTTTVDTENKSWLDLSFETWANATIVYTSWKTVKVDNDNKKLYKWDTLKVIDWSLMIDFPTFWKFNLDKNWELEYTQNWEISLNSSYLWVNTLKNLNIKMKYAVVKIWENSVVSLDQNEVWSTIYLINWTVNVSNLAWKSIDLEKWEKINISSSDTSNKDISLEKEPIDDYFKSNEWYTKNNWDSYLSLSWSLDSTWMLDWTSTWELSWSWEKVLNTNSNELISIDFPTWDEAFSETPVIDIEWTLLDESIAEITINWISAKINKETNKFSLKKFNLENKTNDLVYKVFNENKDVLWKYVKTIYYEWGKDNITSTSWFNVENFSVDASDFKFTRPSSEWIYTTYDDEVSIYWETPAWVVKKVTVNWYQLKTFNWTTWRYHAKKIYSNLADWTNVYEIKYYWDADKLVYKNTFTIIKKTEVKK